VTAAGGTAPTRGGRGGNGRIRLEDPVGDFRMGKIEPGFTGAAFATSVAMSKWYPVTDAAGVAVKDARFLALVRKATEPSGTRLGVEVEATTADAAGNPDPTKSTGFTTDLGVLRSAEFVRFRATFRSEPGTSTRATLDELRLPFE